MPGISIRNKIRKLPYADMAKLPSTKVPEQVPVGSDYYTDDSSISPMTEAERAIMGKWKDKPIDPYGVENWEQEFLQKGGSGQVRPDDEGFDAALMAATAGAYGLRGLGRKAAERAAARPPRSESLQRLFRDPPSPDNVPTGTGRPSPLDVLSDDWIGKNTAYPKSDAVGNVHNLQAKRERRDQYNDLVSAYAKSKAVKKPSREIGDDELLDIYDKDRAYWDSFPED
jgi:hypothetical protein